MGITERLANLNIPTVIVIVLVLLGIRYVLLKQESHVAKSIAETAESLAIALGLVFLVIRPFVVQAFFIPSESMVPALLKDDHILVNKFIYRVREPKLGDVAVFKSPPEAGKDEADFIKRVIGVPGDTVRITEGRVVVGKTSYSHTELRNMLVRFAPEGGRGTVKLLPGKVLVDGRLVTDAEIAGAAEEPAAKVKVFPGTVYLNGKPLNEPYTAEDPETPYPDDITPREWLASDQQHREVVKIPPGRLLVMGDNRNDSLDARRWGLLERSRMRGKAMFIFYPPGRIQWIR